MRFSRGGNSLKVHAVANVKLPVKDRCYNAIERFWGRRAKASGRKDARRQPAQCRRQSLRPRNPAEDDLSAKLIGEADKDLHRLGLLLDNLQIQNISDDVSYLSSVGRVRSARIKEARIAELQAWASAAVQKAHNQMNAEISKIDTDTQVAQKKTSVASWKRRPSARR